MPNTPVQAAAEGWPPTGEFDQRLAFDRLVWRWKNHEQRRSDPDLDPETSDRLNMSWADLDLAREVLAFPTPQGHLCCLRDKLDVIIHYMSTEEPNMDAHSRLVFLGICALRADIVHHGG